VTGLLALWPAVLDDLRERTPGRLFIAHGLACDGAVGAAVTCWSRGLRGERVALDDRAAAPTEPAAAERPLPLPSALAALAWRAVLGVAYFAALTPYSLLLRLIGVEFLAERFSERGTYWKIRPSDESVLALRRRV
jgi:hypothetical protein